MTRTKLTLYLSKFDRSKIKPLAQYSNIASNAHLLLDNRFLLAKIGCKDEKELYGFDIIAAEIQKYQ